MSEQTEHEQDAAPPISVLLSRVSASAGTVAKSQRNAQQGFSFRGIDAVLNAVGPALREHGVVVVPSIESIDYSTAETRSGGVMTVVRGLVSFRFIGPNGDELISLVPAESFDAGDKATSKMMSVALRTCLLQTLALPTDERDPDHDVYERASTQQQQTTTHTRRAAADPDVVAELRQRTIDSTLDNAPGKWRDAALRSVYDEAREANAEHVLVEAPSEWRDTLNRLGKPTTLSLQALIGVARVVPSVDVDAAAADAAHESDESA